MSSWSVKDSTTRT